MSKFLTFFKYMSYYILIFIFITISSVLIIPNFNDIENPLALISLLLFWCLTPFFIVKYLYTKKKNIQDEIKSNQEESSCNISIETDQISSTSPIHPLIKFINLFNIFHYIKNYQNHKQEIQRLQQEKKESEIRELFNVIKREFINGVTPLETSINLPEKETVFFQLDNIEWQESRKTTTSVSYVGINQRLKIAKGLSVNIGNIMRSPNIDESLTIIETGQLYITNKKILLVGKNGSKNIPIEKILNITVYSSAIGIVRSTGKKVVFSMNLENIIRCKIILEFILGNSTLEELLSD